MLTKSFNRAFKIFGEMLIFFYPFDGKKFDNIDYWTQPLKAQEAGSLWETL